jgi:GxxExxY protein
MPPVYTTPLSTAVIGAAIAVHRALGPGLLESAYDHCLECEFARRSLKYARELAVPVAYDGSTVDCGYRVDFVVESELLVETKAVERILPVHHAQVLTYLKLLNLKHGLLINFNVPLLKHGLKSFLR